MSWILVLTFTISGYVGSAHVQTVGPFATYRACMDLAEKVTQDLADARGRYGVRHLRSARCVDLNAP